MQANYIAAVRANTTHTAGLSAWWTYILCSVPPQLQRAWYQQVEELVCLHQGAPSSAEEFREIRSVSKE